MKNLKRQLILISCLIVLSQSQEWLLFNKNFFGDFPQSEIEEWNISVGTVGIKQTCGSDIILGGFNKFSQQTSLERGFNFLPELTQVRVRANLYFLDDWTNAINNNINIGIGNEITAIGQPNLKQPPPFVQLCGNPSLDLKKQVEAIFNTSNDILNVSFKDNLSLDSSIQSWGINNISIEYLATCDGETTIDEDGFIICNLDQQCHDNLGTLMDGEGNIPITNTCQLNPILADSNIFQFHIILNPPYIYDRDCLFFRVFFGGKELDRNQFLFPPVNSWSFNPLTQTVEFNIPFSAFDGDMFECTHIEEEDKFTWICDYSVDLISLGEVQVTYSAKIMVCIDRIKDGELIINVQKNKVIGECCENELNIQTELNICETSDCSSYLNPPIQLTRKTPFFVEQRIITPQFQHYYLELIQVQLGEFFPIILNQDNSQPGRLILELSSNISKQDLLLSVISKLHKTKPSLRFLEENSEDIREDYKLKSVEQVSVFVDSDFQDQQEFKASKKNKDGMSDSQTLDIFVIGASILCIFLIAFVIVIGLKNRKEEGQRLKKQNNEDSLSKSSHGDSILELKQQQQNE